ncbi:cupin domain-containing protein [Nocardia takedensis]|uniref:cupin domain-containing protein n=1 Tax=Nocardia takedensis TaxID=259390 RepID=UPI000316886B|nr:cupin domain-containing protein [Nocardia takedensis]
MNAVPTRPASVRLAHEAEVLGSDQARIRLHIDADRTEGSVSTVEVELARGADGALPHYHTRSDELFYIAEGELRLLAGDRILTVATGGSVVVPRYMHHAFGATPDSGARVLIALMPGVERFEYFRLLDRLGRGEADPAELDAAQDTFDNHFVDAPRWWADRGAHRS